MHGDRIPKARPAFKSAHLTPPGLHLHQYDKNEVSLAAKILSASIIRQICNSNNITYTKKMVYHNSSYEIVYYIFLNPGINNAVEDVSNNIIN